MTTTVGCALTVETAEPVEAVLSVAVDGPTTESLSTSGLPVREVRDALGTRLHLLTLPAGTTTLRYDATVEPRAVARPVTDLEATVARRPSRYCPSDLLAGLATRELAGASVDDVVSWVAGRLSYDSSASRPVDSALDTLLTGRGVCRDYAHLVVTLLRGLDVPARVVSVYAPGLSPMDFHAVAEVAVDGTWQVLDATGLAPRPSMVRIATGQDAADTAFLSTTGAAVTLQDVQVWASTDGDLPADGVTHLA